MIDEIKADLPESSAEEGGNDLKTFASGAPVALFGRVFGRGIYVGGQILLARLLGPEAFGLFAIGLTLFSLVGGLIPMGLDNGIIHFASPFVRTDGPKFKGALLSALQLILASGLFWAGVFFILAGWLAERVFEAPALLPIFRGFALALPFSGALEILAAATRISKRMKFTVLTRDIGQPLLQLVLMFVFYLIGWGLIGAVFASAISFWAMAGLAAYFVTRLFAKAWAARAEQTVSYAEYLKFSLPTAVATIFSAYIIWVGRLMIGYLRPAAEAGIYQAASQASVLFAVVMTGINTMMIPMFADLFHHKRQQRLAILYRVSTKWSLHLNLPLILIICLAPQETMRIIFGGAYEPGAKALVILTLSQLINAGTGPVGGLLLMGGRPLDWALLSGAALALEIGIGAALIPSIGVSGAALAVSVATAFLFLGGVIRAKQVLNLWPYNWKYIKVIVAGLSALIVLLAARILGILASPAGLLFAGTISIAIYAALIRLQGLDAEDSELLDALKNRLRSFYPQIK